MTRQEAIDKLKRLCSPEQMTALKVLVPELQESEDERIRKELWEYFHDLQLRSDSDFSPSFTIDDVLAYLEKQKAKERLDRMAPIYNNKESFESALEKAWKYYNESASRTVDSFEDDYIECVFSKGFREGFLYREKQKEQKPLPGFDDFTPDEKMNHPLYLEGFDVGRMVGQVEAEQKPTEWSGDIIRKAIKEVGLTQHQINWFKNNVFPPKQEWSEEDEEHLDSIIESYKELLKDYSANNGVDYIPYDTPVVARTVLNDIKFIKSLRSRPKSSDNWKPSEEQMNALSWAINYLADIEPARASTLALLKFNLKSL